MTDLESMTARVDRLERQLQITRTALGTISAVAVAFVIGGACKHDTPVAPTTKLELRAPGGETVRIEPTGIVIEGPRGTMTIAAGSISADTKTQHVTLSAEALTFPGANGTTAFTHDSLIIEHGKHKIELGALDDDAHVIVQSDSLRRAVELIANPSYASVLTTFLPVDNVSPPNSSQLSADATGGDLTLSKGTTHKSVTQH